MDSQACEITSESRCSVNGLWQRKDGVVRLNTIMISVIIPVYNGEKFLRETVDTLCNSDYQNLEILLIDDGSSDKSPAICDDLADCDSRIHVLHKENGGICSARNAGLSMANGDYIAFCDQDDCVEPEMYRTMLERMIVDASQLAICSTGRIRIADGEVAKTPYEHLIDGCFTGEDIHENILYPLIFNGYTSCNGTGHRNPDVKLYGTIWKCLIDRNLIKNRSFRRFVNYEDDYIMFLELITQAETITTIEETLYYWRINEISESETSGYVTDLAKKQQALDDELISIVKRSITPVKMLPAYRTVRCYWDIVEFIMNLRVGQRTGQIAKSKAVSINLYPIVRYAKQLERKAKYWETFVGYCDISYVKNKLILSNVVKGRYLTAYAMAGAIEAAQKIQKKSGFLLKLERSIKGIDEKDDE